MKTYEFTSGTSKGDMIMGLLFPVVLVIPTLTIWLILFYSRIWDALKSSPLMLWIVPLPGLLLTYLILNKNRNGCRKKFSVYLDKLNIVVTENGNEVMRGKVLFCNLKVTENKFVMLDIATGGEKIAFRSRPREYRTLTGSISFNPFGTSDMKDMEQLTALGREIKGSLDTEGTGGI